MAKKQRPPRRSSRGKRVARRTAAARRPARTRGPSPRERYALVIAAVAEGIYEWTVASGQLEISPRLSELFGFDKGDLTSAHWVELSLIHI